MLIDKVNLKGLTQMIETHLTPPFMKILSPVFIHQLRKGLSALLITALIAPDLARAMEEERVGPPKSLERRLSGGERDFDFLPDTGQGQIRTSSDEEEKGGTGTQSGGSTDTLTPSPSTSPEKVSLRGSNETEGSDASPTKSSPEEGLGFGEKGAKEFGKNKKVAASDVVIESRPAASSALVIGASGNRRAQEGERGESLKDRKALLEEYLSLDLFTNKGRHLGHALEDIIEEQVISEESRLLPPRSGKEEVELGNRPFPSKAEFIKRWVARLMTQKRDQAVKIFEEWLSQAQQNALQLPLVVALGASVDEKNGALPNPYVRRVRDLVQQYKELGSVTVQEWLERLGFFGSQAQKAPLSKDLDTLFKRARKAIVLETANRLVKAEFDDWDPRAKAFLAYHQKYNVEERYLPRQWLLAAASVITTIGDSIVQGIIFAWGMDAFFDKIGYGDAYDGTTRASMIVLGFTGLTTLLDDGPRNLQEFVSVGKASKSQFLRPLTWEQWSANTGKSLLRKGLALLPVSLAVFYFFLIEHEGYIYAKKHDQSTTQFIVFFSTLVGFQFLSEFVGSNQQLREVGEAFPKRWKKMKAWVFDRIEDSFLDVGPVRWAMSERSLTDDEIMQADFVRTLKDLRRVVYAMDESAVVTAYHEVYKPMLKRRNQNPLSPETFDGNEAFLTLSYFMQFLKNEQGEQIIDESEGCTSKSWRQYAAVGVGGFLVSWATFACFKTLNYVMSYYLESMGLNSGVTETCLAALGGVLATLVISTVSQMSIEDNVNKTFGKKVHSRTSHPWARTVIGLLSVAIGLYKTLPYLVSGWLAMQEYSPVVQAVTLTPFVLTDAHSNGWQLKDTYGSYVHLMDRVSMKLCGSCCETGGCCCGGNVDYMRDKLVKWFDKLIDLARDEQTHPVVIEQLNRKLDSFARQTFESLDSRSVDEFLQGVKDPRSVRNNRDEWNIQGGDDNEGGFPSSLDSEGLVHGISPIGYGGNSGSFGAQGSFREMYDLTQRPQQNKE